MTDAEWETRLYMERISVLDEAVEAIVKGVQLDLMTPPDSPLFKVLHACIDAVRGLR